MNIPFSPPYIDEDVINEVNDSLRSGWITTGPKVAALEKGLQEYCKAKRVNCVNSWTSGAILMLRWLGLKQGDEVIVPCYTYCATAMAVMDAGGIPIMVDITRNLTIDVEKIKQAITPKTKAILPVDLGGVPCDYENIMQLICSKEVKEQFTPTSENQKKLGRIMLISDSAHSLGATLNNKTITELVDVCILSLHAVKNLTSAEGGAICLNMPEPFNNDELYKELRILSLNGQTKDAFTKTKAGAWRYDIIAHGMKINMPDVNAAIALAQLRKYDYLLSERKRVYERYSNLFKEYHWAIIPQQDSQAITTSYHLYPLRINPITEEQRDKLIQYLADLNIATNVHYIPMPMLTLFKNMGYKIEDYPIAYDTYTREISLPIYPQLTNQQIDYIVKNLVEGYYSITL
ncbi:MAG: DegT/DnrJ/EryC1/StrS family aminotransferase [Bacteroidales bacterium]|nr:DegT/DnrJ/EryC1/StrS family aminotransferase [Bacteroidales bacterium]MDD4001850.1 DegT/DnrJ/EryC1/StrS family aminotransferase [Bacteroidales bacterium]MDD4528714.1 DegT/DnrJ/EryC1/StrS family aminotransferase [Bacteroidales bacterium]MDD4829993.1 DegT/DnrJ/EryC1/StrS family aminotransferase [Bacteroidales bacterium]